VHKESLASSGFTVSATNLDQKLKSFREGRCSCRNGWLAAQDQRAFLRRRVAGLGGLCFVIRHRSTPDGWVASNDDLATPGAFVRKFAVGKKKNLASGITAHP